MASDATLLEKVLPTLIATLTSLTVFFLGRYWERYTEKRKKREEREEKVKYSLRLVKRVKKQTTLFRDSTNNFVNTGRKDLSLLFQLEIITMTDFNRTIEAFSKEETAIAYIEYFKTSATDIGEAYEKVVTRVDFLNAQILAIKDSYQTVKNEHDLTLKSIQENVDTFTISLEKYFQNIHIPNGVDPRDVLNLAVDLRNIYQSYVQGLIKLKYEHSASGANYVYKNLIAPIYDTFTTLIENIPALENDDSIFHLLQETKRILAKIGRIAAFNEARLDNIEILNRTISEKLGELVTFFQPLEDFKEPKRKFDFEKIAPATSIMIMTIIMLVATIAVYRFSSDTSTKIDSLSSKFDSLQTMFRQSEDSLKQVNVSTTDTIKYDHKKTDTTEHR